MLTKKKDLRTGQPVWTAYRTPKIPHQKLERDIKTDVAIIGAGISGAMIADELSDAGLSVVMLDRRGPAKGSTLATTALLQYEIDQPVLHMQRQIGFDKTAQAWRRSKLAIDSLAARLDILGIECDLERKNTIYTSGNVLNVTELKEERMLRNRIGIQTDFLNRQELQRRYGVNAAGALESYDSLSANPHKICAGLLNIAVQRGAKIFAPVTVTEVDAKPRHVTLYTDKGYKVTAKHVVFATGYEVPKQLGQQDFKINSTWTIATRPQRKTSFHDLPLVWQAADPYLYLRTTPDGRIICGGEDEHFVNEDKRDALLPKKTAILQRKLAAILPGVDATVDYAWCGSFGATPTGLPLIGRVPRYKNCYAVMAFGGNGITFSRIGAEMIRGMITGYTDPDEVLFKFQ